MDSLSFLYVIKYVIENVNQRQVHNCLGVFNSSLISQAIFNFRRYKDGSLSYTGINMHKDGTSLVPKQ